MSEENVEIVRRAHEALNRGDVDGALTDVDPDVEVDWSQSRSAEGGMIEDVIRGREALRARIQDAFDHWNVSWGQREYLEVSDDRVLSTASVRFRGRDGIEREEHDGVHVREWAVHSPSDDPRASRSPRSRRAAGVGAPSALSGKKPALAASACGGG